MQPCGGYTGLFLGRRPAGFPADPTSLLPSQKKSGVTVTSNADGSRTDTEPVALKIRARQRTDANKVPISRKRGRCRRTENWQRTLKWEIASHSLRRSHIDIGGNSASSLATHSTTHASTAARHEFPSDWHSIHKCEAPRVRT